MLTTSPCHCTRRSRHEDAFSLIELVVALVLLVIVIGGVVMAVTRLGQGNGEAMTDRRAQREALDALEQLRSDVRAARSPALEAWDARRENLREIIAFGVDSTASATPDAAHLACGGLAFADCVRDITVARGSELWMRADVRSGPGWDGAECIGYVRDASGLARIESRGWQTCGSGTTGTTTRLVSASSLSPTPFRYTLRYHPTMVIRQVADPDQCQTYRGVQDVPAGQLNYVNAVDVDFRGVLAERNTAAASSLRTSLPITSRTAGDYTYATGCSY